MNYPLDEAYHDRCDHAADRERDTYCPECGGMNGEHTSSTCPENENEYDE